MKNLPHPQYDIAVVGSGLAGLQCARLLGHSGYRVLLADRKREPGVPVHTTGIFVRKTLEDFHLPDACLGSPVRRVALHSPAGRRIDLTSPRDEFRLGRMRPLYTRFLDDAQAANVDWAGSHRFVSARQHSGGSDLRFETPRGPRTVRARFLIGADGVLSPVARALDLSRNREWIVGVEDVFPIDANQLDAALVDDGPVFHCFVDPSVAPGYIAWVIPDAATGLHVGVGGYPEKFRPTQALDRFVHRTARQFSLQLSARLERRAGRIPVGGVLPQLASRHGLLVGDAAGAASPLTAGGLDACLRLSEFAAAVTNRFLEGDRSDVSLLESYSGRQLARRFVSRRLMRNAFSLFQKPLPIELAFHLLSAGPFTSLARHIFFGRGSFPDPKPEFQHLCQPFRALRV